jgi:hypothetical protein
MVAEPTGDANVWDNLADRSPVAIRLDRIYEELVKLNKKAESAPTQPGYFELRNGVVRATHIKLRALKIVFSLSAADNVVLRIGTQAFTFYDLGSGLNQIDFGRVIERGIDVSLTVTGAATLGAAWLVFTPE